MHSIKKILISTIITLVVCLNLTISISANTNLKIEGNYAHPNTGIIIDSGGESSLALGQSMIDKMIVEDAEFDSKAQTLTFKIQMMSNVSDVKISLEDEGNYTSLSYDEVEIDNETSSFTIPFNNLDSIIRLDIFIAVMGREVSFFISPLTDTNSGVVTNPSVPSTDDSLILGGSAFDGLVIEDNMIKIDDSVWLTLFMSVFSAITLAGSLLIVINKLINLPSKKNISKRKVNDDKLNINLEDINLFEEENV